MREHQEKRMKHHFRHHSYLQPIRFQYASETDIFAPEEHLKKACNEAKFEFSAPKKAGDFVRRYLAGNFGAGWSSRYLMLFPCYPMLYIIYNAVTPPLGGHESDCSRRKTWVTRARETFSRRARSARVCIRSDRIISRYLFAVSMP